MPRIIQQQPQKGSYIPNFKVAQSPVREYGVSKARDIKLNTSPVNKLAGVAEVGRAIGGALQTGSQIYDTVKQKVETIRVSKSQGMQEELNDQYRDIQKDAAKLSGSQLVDAYDGVVKKAEELINSEEYNNLDAATKSELSEYNTTKLGKLKDWYTNRIIQKAGEANIEALNKTVTGAKRDINSLPAGDLAGIAEQVDRVVQAQYVRNPQMSEEDLAQFSTTMSEELLTTGIDQWSSNNPTTMIRIWDENPQFFKEALVETYAKVTKDMKRVRETSNYDVAKQHLRSKFGKDFSGAAEHIKDIYDGTDKTSLNLTDNQYVELISEFSTLATTQMNYEEKQRVQVEKDFVAGLYDEFRNPDGSWNIISALEAITKADKDDVISAEKYDILREQIQGGGEYTPAAHKATIRAINTDMIQTKDELLTHLAGKNVKPDQYFAQLQRRQEQRTAGLVENYYAVSREYFDKLAKIRRPSELPSGIADRSLLVRPTDSGDFMVDLEAKAMEEGLSAGSPKIYDIAKEMLSVKSYDPDTPETLDEPLGRGAQLFQNLPFTENRINIRSWQHERQFSKDDTDTSILKGAMYTKPEESKALNEIATSGSPKQKAAIQKIIELQKTMKMPLTLQTIKRVMMRLERDAANGGQ